MDVTRFTECIEKVEFDETKDGFSHDEFCEFTCLAPGATDGYTQAHCVCTNIIGTTTKNCNWELRTELGTLE